MHPRALFPQEGQLTQPPGLNEPPGLPRGVGQLAGLLWCPATGSGCSGGASDCCTCDEPGLCVSAVSSALGQ